MIVQFFLSFFSRIGTYLVTFFPVADALIVSNITVAVNQLKSFITISAVFLPDNFNFCAASIIALEVGLIVWRASKWLLTNVSFGFFKK